MTTATVSDHRFDLQPRSGINTAASQTPEFLQLLNAALAGGQSTFDFFSGDFSQLQTIMGTIATGGDEVWIEGNGNDENGKPDPSKPVMYVAQGNTFVTIGHEWTDTAPLKDGTGGTTTTKPVGVTVVTFTTSQGTSQMLVADIVYGGYGLAGLFTIPVLANIAKSVIVGVARFLGGLARRLWARISGGGSVNPDEAEEQASSDAEDSASEAGLEGAEITEGLTIDLTISVVGKVFFVAGVIIAVITFLLQLLSKKMTGYFRFYNQTALDVKFGVGMVADDTGMMQGPATAGTTVTVSKISAPPAPPWITPTDKGIYYAEATFLNNNTLAGIGYVVEATASGDFPGFRALVNIPAEGENSLYITLTEEDSKQLWTKETENNPNPDYDLTATATSGRYKLSIATNAIQGQSPNPYDKSEGYNYEHLLVLTDGSAA